MRNAEGWVLSGKKENGNNTIILIVRTANNYRSALRNNFTGKTFGEVLEEKNILPRDVKLLAWSIFLVYFIENGTLGLLPRSYYFVYRNIRVSDVIIYGLIVYSLFNFKQWAEMYRSPVLLVVKSLLLYLVFQFIVSVILYEQNFLEYFFRLKDFWTSFMIFPFLFLIYKKGLPYLIKLMLPTSIISNILYIASYILGVALLPEISIVQTDVPGGYQVNRIFGGTFFGEYFFLGFVFQWITDKVRPYQVVLALIFITPHILALGRSAWVTLLFAIIVMFIYNFLKQRTIKDFAKPLMILIFFSAVLVYVFVEYFPQSDYLSDAIGARVEQGQENFENQTGTFGTRLESNARLIELWSKSNIFFGIGMHPMIVTTPVTVEEANYSWGFSDVRWTSMLAAYGLVGFLLAVIFQIYYVYKTIRILMKSKKNSIYTFLALTLLFTMLFDTLINFSYNLVTVRIWGLVSLISLCLSALVYKDLDPEA